jgi:hypothetical protein
MGPRIWRFLRKELIVLDDLGGVRFNMRVSFYAKRYKEQGIPLARETILPEKDILCAGGLEEQCKAVDRNKNTKVHMSPQNLFTCVPRTLHKMF